MFIHPLSRIDPSIDPGSLLLVAACQHSVISIPAAHTRWWRQSSYTSTLTIQWPLSQNSQCWRLSKSLNQKVWLMQEKWETRESHCSLLTTYWSSWVISNIGWWEENKCIFDIVNKQPSPPWWQTVNDVQCAPSAALWINKHTDTMKKYPIKYLSLIHWYNMSCS